MKIRDVLNNFKWDMAAKLGIGLVKIDSRLRCRLFLPVTPGGLIIPSEEINEEYRLWLMEHDQKDYPHLWKEDEKGRRERRHRVMTTAFVDFIVDQLQTETSEFGDFKYHQCGLGSTAENIADTAIETDTGIAPVAGTQTETDHDTYKSVATMTMDDTEAIREHVLMSQSGAGTLMDRTLFAAINVVPGNQIEFTFEGSFTAGG